MKLLILTIIVVAFCVFALSFNIIFRKDGKFPDGEISHNKELRKKGLQCAKVEEKMLWGPKGSMKKNKNKDSSNIDNDACRECMGDCYIKEEKN